MKWKILLAVIIAVHVLILAKMVFFPYPELFLYPYLANHGFLPYKQIFDQHFPSILMLPVNISTFGLTSPATARIFSVGLAGLTQLFIFITGRHIFKNEKLALLANLFYLFIQPIFEGYVLWIDTFIGPVLVAAFYFFWRYFEVKHPSDAFLAGLFIGASILIKQSILPLAAVLAIFFYLKTKSLKATLIYCLGVAIPVFGLLYWILAKGLLADFYYWTVTFNLNVYSKMAGKFPTLKQLLRVVVFFAPAVLIFFTKARSKLVNVVSGIFLLFSLGAAGNRFELVHLQPALPFVALLTASYAQRLKNKKRRFILGGIFVVLAFLTIYLVRNVISDNIYFFDETTIKTAQEVDGNTTTNQRIFVVGSQPIIYFQADRLPAGGVFSVNVPWNMKIAEDIVLAGIEKDRPALVVRDPSATIDGILVMTYMQKINKFVDANYEFLEKVGANEILIPKKAIK